MLILAACIAACAVVALPATTPVDKGAQPIGPVEWTVVGPFEHAPDASNKASDREKSGFDDDFLKPLGGESNASISGAEAKTWQEGISAQKTKAGPEGFVNLLPHFKNPQNKVSYAFGTIESDKEQDVVVHFGSDDSAKVWVNNKLVHTIWAGGGRAAAPWQEEINVSLRKGTNNVLVKVQNGTGDWCFYFDAYTAEGHRAVLFSKAGERLPDLEIGPTSSGSYILDQSGFPTLGFKEASLVAPLLKSTSPKVRWFNESLNELTAAEGPGLYLAYVEATTLSGAILKKIIPFHRPSSPALAGLVEWPPTDIAQVNVSIPKQAGISSDMLSKAKPVLNGFASMTLWKELGTTERGPAILRYLDTLSTNSPIQTDPNEPFLRVLDLQLKLKAKLYGRAFKPVNLVQRADKPGRVLRVGSAKEAGMSPDVVAKLDSLCKEWAKAEGKPFSVVVARHGVAFMHSAYGELNGKPLNKNALFYPASIGKVMCGLTFLMFMEQGLLQPETPIGSILPDWPTEGPKAVTFRNCFTHTSGIAGHGTYGGLWNPMLDNSFAVGRLENLKPSVRHAYGGDGNNLAAKAMELVAGKPFIRLLQENLFGPIGAKVDQDDLGWINTTTAMDLAKVAQMMLNQGTYGEHRFFNAATFEKMLPVGLSSLYPNLDNKEIEWGLCLTHMTDPDADPVTNPLPLDTNVLGPNVFGHGSASSSILRVDFDHDLLIVMGRYGVGDPKAHQEYRGKFMQTLKGALSD